MGEVGMYHHRGDIFPALKKKKTEEEEEEEEEELVLMV
jgi:hypothetical protein